MRDKEKIERLRIGIRDWKNHCVVFEKLRDYWSTEHEKERSELKDLYRELTDLDHILSEFADFEDNEISKLTPKTLSLIKQYIINGRQRGDRKTET